MKFVALETFNSPEMHSNYCKGLWYTVRTGNDLLASMAKKWQHEGKVKIYNTPQNSATVTGKGFVSNPRA